MSAQCQATILIKDDRYGGFRDRCEGLDGHIGPHSAALTGCEPMAWLSWIGSYEPAPVPQPPEVDTTAQSGDSPAIR